MPKEKKKTTTTSAKKNNKNKMTKREGMCTNKVHNGKRAFVVFTFPLARVASSLAGFSADQ